MLTNILKKILYNPRKHADRHPGISVDKDAVLLPSANFRMFSDSNKVDVDKNTILACNFVFESSGGHIEIGEGTFINGGTSLICRTGIKIGRFVTVAWDCTIYDHNSHSLDYRERILDIKTQLVDYRAGIDFIKNKNWNSVKSKEIIIEDYVWIGMNCIILCGVTLGEGAVIGAGSVVRENVEPWTVVAGNPAQFIKRLKDVD